MKKLLMSSAVLLIFGVSITLFQISCSKDSTAGPAGAQQINKLLFNKYSSTTGTEIWTSNYDGSGQTRIDITLPSGRQIADENMSLSPDGSKIFFKVLDASFNDYIYSADINGNNPVQIISGGAFELEVNGAY